MLCKVNGKAPPPEEALAWEKLLVELTRIGAEANRKTADMVKGKRSPGIRDIQIYGKARPAPEDPLTEALPRSCLETRPSALQKAIAEAGLDLLIQVFP